MTATEPLEDEDGTPQMISLAPRRVATEYDDLVAKHSDGLFSLIKKRRGWDDAFLASLNASTTEPLPDIDEAVRLIHRAVSSGEQITVLTDYDMDGVAAGLLAYGGLAELGAEVNLVVPHYEGPRDVTDDKVDQALQIYPATSLIMTCDVGINSNSGIDRAHEMGIDVVIADHHIENDDDPCRADAVVDPNRNGCDYPEPDICGSQVALHILLAYAREHRPDKLAAISMLSIFAGIGGQADVMPLRGQTRALVRRSVSMLSLSLPHVPVYKRNDPRVPWFKWGTWDIEDPKGIRPNTATLMEIILADEHDWRFARLFHGMAVLLKQLVLAGKIRSLDDIDPSFIGFTLTPMFNATRRINGDMADSFMVFAPQVVQACRPDYTRTQFEATAQLVANNEYRKEITARAMEDLAEREQPFAPFVWFSDGIPGILGLLASNVTKQTGLPAVVLNESTLSGSARAPEWVDVLGLVASLERRGLRAAGHHQACGVHAEDEDDVRALADAFADLVDALPPGDGHEHPDLLIADIDNLGELDPGTRALLDKMAPDCHMPPAGELLDLVRVLRTLEPYGQGFPEPEIAVVFQPAHSSYKLMSLREGVDPEAQDLGPEHYKHLKITTPHGLELVWWNQAEKIEEVQASELATATVTLSINKFNGTERPQAIVRDLLAHRAQEPE